MGAFPGEVSLVELARYTVSSRGCNFQHYAVALYFLSLKPSANPLKYPAPNEDKFPIPHPYPSYNFNKTPPKNTDDAD